MIRVILSFLLAFAYCQVFSQITSNLPIVIINTLGEPINDEPGVVVDFKIINNASGINTSTDSPNEYSGKAKAEYRGCSSQSFPKKSFGIELRDSDNTSEDNKEALLGFPEESDWVLNASYTDKTFIREVLGFELAGRTGRYASRTLFVELLLDGQYQGIYIFQEKVKRDSGRVPIQKLAPDDTEMPKITGGYILKIDKSCGNEDPGWTSQYDSPNQLPGRRFEWKLHYPKLDAVNEQQLQYIKSHIESFENTMAGTNVCDNVSGYASFIDEDSFIDYILVQEVLSNPDEFRFSSFFHKARNGKIQAGPVWDFNLSGGFFTEPMSGYTHSYEGWRFKDIGDPALPVPFFWWKLLDCSRFKQRLIDRYRALRESAWSTGSLTSLINEKYGQLDQGAYNRNFSKWPILNVQVWTDSPTFVGGSVEAEHNHLSTWLTSRLEWLDENIATISEAPLPVTFASFEAMQMEEDVLVEWTTSFESNASYFEIERAADGRHFTPLGKIKARSESEEMAAYNFIDGSPFPGTSYYRIRQVDSDGQYTYTQVTSVNVDPVAGNALFVSPNPARDFLQINSARKASWKRYRIFDMAGRMVQSDILKNDAGIPIGHLNTGIYTIRLDSGNAEQEAVRFVVE